MSAAVTSTVSPAQEAPDGAVPEAPASRAGSTGQAIVIEAPRGFVSLDVRELWRYRELLAMLVWRDVSSKYRQSVIGYGWVFLKPLVSVLIFTLVFGRLAGLSSEGAPYALFALAAIIPWNYFSNSLAGVSSSVLGGAGLLTKVYFPRLILPLASLGAGLADLMLQLVLLAGVMAWYGAVPGWQILALPGFLLLTIFTSLGFGLWLTALNVRFRDVGHAVPFLLQAWMWISPVVYSSSLVPERWRWLYGLNPLVGVIDGFRWSILGLAAPNWTTMGLAVGIVSVTLLGGLVFFRRQELSFADII